MDCTFWIVMEAVGLQIQLAFGSYRHAYTAFVIESRILKVRIIESNSGTQDFTNRVECWQNIHHALLRMTKSFRVLAQIVRR
jgi:hypothetical protein